MTAQEAESTRFCRATSIVSGDIGKSMRSSCTRSPKMLGRTGTNLGQNEARLRASHYAVNTADVINRLSADINNLKWPASLPCDILHASDFVQPSKADARLYL
jgi:hypothetical protein